MTTLEDTPGASQQRNDMRDRLRQLEEFILFHVPDAKLRSMVDTGELSDRAVAERAGIGWSGKNCSIITPEFGSYVYLGEMITNIPFEPDTPIEDECGDCRLCWTFVRQVHWLRQGS